MFLKKGKSKRKVIHLVMDRTMSVDKLLPVEKSLNENYQFVIIPYSESEMKFRSNMDKSCHIQLVHKDKLVEK